MITEFHEHFLRREIKEDEKRSAIIFAIEGVCILTLFFYVLYLNKQLLQAKSAFQNQQTTPVAATANAVITPTPTPYAQNAKTSLITQNTSISPLVKDYYVPLGTGVSSAFAWEAVPGAQVKLDFSSYTSIKTISLEASTFVPTGNESVSVRLYNVTDQHPVWNSEMMIDANTVDIKTSPPLIYDTGEKLYQIQMKTQLGSPANLTSSRIHIRLN